jgi:lysophospholipase L1-like esterase
MRIASLLGFVVNPNPNSPVQRRHSGNLLVSLAACLCLVAQAAAVTVPIRILPLGDSITAGWGGDANLGGYRAPLYALLTAAGYNVNFIGLDNENSGTMVQPQHEGHPGWRIRGIASYLPAWLDAVDNPDVVLLHIGTNDFGYNDSPETAIDRLDALITQIATLRPYAHIIVTTLLQRGDSRIDTLFNPFVQGKVNAQAALGRRVTYLDMHAVVPLSGLADGLHPNQTGYNLMANAWLPAIQAVCGVNGDASAPAIASVTGSQDYTHVAITFSKPMGGIPTNLANFTFSGGLTCTKIQMLDPARRIVTLTTSPQQVVGTSYTVTVNGLVDRITPTPHPIAPNSRASFKPAIARGFSNNVAESAGYSLVYSLDIPAACNFSAAVPYAVDNHASVGAFSRVAYYLELQTPTGALKYVWASMDAFTSDAGKIGVPSAASGAVFQQSVSGMNVVSNVAGVATGTGLTGSIEFWPTNYSGDTRNSSGNYGSMRISQTAAAQTVFAFNAWGGYGGYADLGIGNDPLTSVSPDWTFAGNANGYSIRTLQVLVANPSFSSWVNGFPGLADPSPDGDPDHDGIPNLMEYVLGGDPRVPSQSGLPMLTRDGANLVLSYKRSAASKLDTTQSGEWSTDLATWHGPIAPAVVNDNGSDPADMILTAPLSNARNGMLYLRLKVTQP